MRMFSQYTFKCVLVGLLLFQAIAAAPIPAQAGNKALLDLLKVLRDNGTINPEIYEAIRAAAVAEEEEEDLAKEQQITEHVDDGVTVNLSGGGLRIESQDENFSFQLGGRIHLDAAWYREDDSDLGDGTEVRRVRLSWKGTALKDWYYRGAVDFAGNEVSLKSLYIRYLGLDPTQITVGSFKEPFSLENLSSSNYSTFMERSAVASELPPGRNIGLGATTHGKNWSASVGGFGEGENDGGGEDEGWAVTGRATFAPINEKKRVVHVGGAGSYRRFNGVDSVRIRARPESHVTGTRLVDTGIMTGIDGAILYGFEAAVVCGPLSLQGEYIATQLHACGPHMRFDGWYAYASWFLTGESRSYKASNGTFGRVKPKGIVGSGGIGAWELAVRFSNLDLTDNGVVGGEQNLLTFGLNWYASPNVRFMANYIEVLEVNRPGSLHDGDEPGIFQIRSQVNF